MKRAIITVGLGFGDEGKGATVDFLVRQFDADLVIRYCGGSQAAHNVQVPDGRRHTFSQFGAGTLAAPSGGVKTWLGPQVIIDPPAMLREALHLKEMGVANPLSLLSVHPSCLVATAWHRALNRLREIARGKDVHGSCGQGMGETRAYWLRYGSDSLFAGDLRNRTVLADKLELQRQRSLLQMQEIIPEISSSLYSSATPDDLEDSAVKALPRHSGFHQEIIKVELDNLSNEALANQLAAPFEQGVALSNQVPRCGETVIFEGAQGVLLDEYRGFPPYTTWSTVTDHHAWDLVSAMGVESVAVLGLTRAYTTRHGAGPLPTWSEELTAQFQDPGNPFNRWQGSLKCGWLDLPLLRYAAAAIGRLDGIVVNHLDQMDSSGRLVCDRYREDFPPPSVVPDLAWQAALTERLRQAEPILCPAGPEEIIQRLAAIAPVVLKGRGPTWEDRDFLGVPFRARSKSDA
jgi:adenylosuccinate synthase